MSGTDALSPVRRRRSEDRRSSQAQTRHLGHILPASERPGGNQRFGPLGADHRQILELLLARAVQIDPAHLVMNFAMASRLALPGVAVSVGLVLVWHAMFLLARPQTRCTVPVLLASARPGWRCASALALATVAACPPVSCRCANRHR